MKRVFVCLILLFVANFACSQNVGSQEFFFIKADESSPLGFNMDDSLALSNKSPKFNFQQFGEWTVSAAISGIGLGENNTESGYPSSTADFSNAQLLIQKKTGVAQFFIQTGLYSVPELGVPYKRANFYTNEMFGYLPQAYASYVPNENLSISIGKLPAMGGYESTFTYQNLNITRGLLWAQTNSVSQGIQINHSANKLNLSFTWNDGSDSGKYNWLGAAASYDINKENNIGIILVGATSSIGPFKPNSTNTIKTPLLDNNSQIFNLIYKYSTNNVLLVPYLQYSYIPADASIGIPVSYSTHGAAILANYKLLNQGEQDSKIKSISLPFRIEYIATTGGSAPNAPTLLYGPGSSAWSLTFTPTYQFKEYFVRLEASLVKAINITSGLGFGTQGTSTSQVRGMLEMGILY